MFMRKIFYLAMMFAMPAMAQVTTVSTLEDTGVEFNEKSYWNGGAIGTPIEGDWGEMTYVCKFNSGKLTGICNYSTMDSYDWWGGVALSKSTSKEFATLDDQYNNVVGSGANGSQTYAVIYGNNSQIEVNVEGGAMVRSLYVTNSAYTHNNFTINTGSLDTKFTAEGDHFYLKITATKADGTEKEEVVKLAEFTDELSYVSEWTRVDLTGFGTDVTKLTFDFDCNKSMVATYACIDDIEVVTDFEKVATFENLTLEPESYWNGTDNTGGFISGAYNFENGHEVYDYGNGYLFDYCYGFYYTNMTSTGYGGDASTEQYKSAVGHGVENSANFATYNVNSFNPKGVEVLAAEGAEIPGFYVTNSAYAYTSMMNGDGYAKKFEEGDWFMLTITGYDAAGEVTGTKDFYLADLRDMTKAYIVKDWYYVDLSALGKVKRLGFTMSSSDNDPQYGIKTPAYFCMDNFGAEGVEVTPEADTTLGIAQVATENNRSQAVYNLAGQKVGADYKGVVIVNGKKVIR